MRICAQEPTNCLFTECRRKPTQNKRISNYTKLNRFCIIAVRCTVFFYCSVKGGEATRLPLTRANERETKLNKARGILAPCAN